MKLVTRIGRFFFEEELACKDGTPYPFDLSDVEDPEGRSWRETRATPLVETLDVIREAVGKPIRINSGFRTREYDQRLYDRVRAESGNDRDKAPPDKSEHPKGRAADISCGSLTSAELHKVIGDLYRAGRLPHLGGLGYYPSFVHIDVRPRKGNHLAQWGGRRLSNVP